MEITLIRHLPTEWNKRNVLQGRKDIPIAPLTNTDQMKINENLTYLRSLLPFDYVLASSLKRTQQTARIYRLEPIIEPLLDEFDFGTFEGKSKEKLIDTLPYTWYENPQALSLGETGSNLEKRIISFIKKYCTSNRILAFGHGSWMRALYSLHKFGHINNMNKITIPNNSYMTLRIHVHSLIKRRQDDD